MRARGNLLTKGSEVVQAAVLEGLGIGLSLTSRCEDNIGRGEPRVLLPDGHAPSLSVHLFSPAQRPAPAWVEAFAEHLATTRL